MASLFRCTLTTSNGHGFQHNLSFYVYAQEPTTLCTNQLRMQHVPGQKRRALPGQVQSPLKCPHPAPPYPLKWCMALLNQHRTTFVHHTASERLNLQLHCTVQPSAALHCSTSYHPGTAPRLAPSAPSIKASTVLERAVAGHYITELVPVGSLQLALDRRYSRGATQAQQVTRSMMFGIARG